MTNKLVKVTVTVPPHIASALKRGTGKATLAEAIEMVMPVLQVKAGHKAAAKKSAKKAAKK